MGDRQAVGSHLQPPAPAEPGVVAAAEHPHPLDLGPASVRPGHLVIALAPLRGPVAPRPHTPPIPLRQRPAHLRRRRPVPPPHVQRVALLVEQDGRDLSSKMLVSSRMAAAKLLINVSSQCWAQASFQEGSRQSYALLVTPGNLPVLLETIRKFESEAAESRCGPLAINNC